MSKYVLYLVIFSFLVTGCKWFRNEKHIEPDPAFMNYISAFTSGVVSAESDIRVSLVNEVPFDVDPAVAVNEKYFDIQPKISGSAYWVDKHTVEFRPNEKMASGEVYQVTFHLDKIFKVDKPYRQFEFSFSTLQQSFMVEVEGYSTYRITDLVHNKINGIVRTADVMDINRLKKVMQARQKNKSLPIQWFQGENPTTFHFIIDSVKRREEKSEVVIEWNGNPINLDIKGNKSVHIPSLSDFEILDIQIVHQPTQYLNLRFSDPIKEQNLEGLIWLSNQTDLSFEVDNNLIRIYPSVRQSGEYTLHVEKGIRNVLDYPFPESQELLINFEALKPAVKLVSNGVIMPQSEQLLLPFEAVNLKAVDVKIVQLYEKNIAQFLQINEMRGNRQLKRVGRLIAKEKIDLVSQNPVDLGAWNTFSLDLANIIKPDPGAIYRVEIGFRKAYSLFGCDGDTDNEEEITDSQIKEEMKMEQTSYWDAWNSYYYNDYQYNYNWRDRDDPCSHSYYRKHNFVAQNVLASNLGIITKKANNGSMQVVITDLKSTRPIQNVKIEILNYQQQKITDAETGENGMAYIDQFNSAPFLLIAKKDKQRGYLRLDDGSSLSLSKFDVSGDVVQQGVKGFIYGDRGVWRPGDTLFLTCIIEDKQNRLPKKQPLSFELIDPRGKRVDRKVLFEGMNGFYHFQTHTEPDAITGYYHARVQLGGIEFTKSLRIETVKPNRLKIELDLGKDKLYSSDAGINSKMQVNWLHGAAARDLDVEVNYTLSSHSTSFKEYKNYNFTDPSREFHPEEKAFFKGTTNQDGTVFVRGTIDPDRTAPGMLNAFFSTRVYEKSGAFSVDRFSIPYSPYSGYVGLKLPQPTNSYALVTDKQHSADIITLTEKGRPVAKNNLKASLYRIQWRWWWNATSDNLASYEGNEYTELMAEKVVSTDGNGKGVFRFNVNKADWGRYFLRIYDPATGHATGKVFYVDWPGRRSRNRDDQPGAASMLVFNADKEKYNVGERAYINLPASDGARALVSLENGSNVLKAFWVENIQTDTLVGIDIIPEMAPNFYVHVTMIQPHAQTKNDLPIRTYGVIPLTVIDPNTILKPVIKMPQKLEPEKPFTVNISEKSGQKMTYTIAIVDEGLLDITRFQTPDPWKHFYAHEALGVKTWDIYDYVLGAYGGRIDGIFSIGGGLDEEMPEAGKRANRFKPVVLFKGPFALNANKSNNHSFTMPNYVGSVKTMVIAGNHGAYGTADKVTPVKKPVMVLATLPRVLGPEEKVELPVTVFAMEEGIESVEVQVNTNSLLVHSGPGKKSVSFLKPGERVVNFHFTVPPRVGIATAEVIAKSGKYISRYNIELQVRNPNPPVTEVISETVEPAESWSKEFALVGVKGTNTGVLEISSIPPIDLDRRLKYLLRYPHGCAEQVASAVFPQIYLEDILEDEAGVLLRANKNVQAGINRLKSFITRDGGFAYWPGHANANDWASSYIGHFMIEAEKKGYELPSGMKNQWVQYQKRQARKWSALYNGHGQTQAYRLYTLALAGEYQMGAMNRLRQSNNLSVQTKWILASAYALAGQEKIARSLTANMSTDVPVQSVSRYTYGSATRDMAMMLETLLLLNDQERIASLSQRIANELNSSRWMSTQTTAYCLMVMSKFAVTKKGEESLNFDYKLNTEKVKKARTNKPFVQIDIPMEKNIHSSVYLKNNGNKLLFARIVNTGVPARKTEEAKSKNLNMQVRYLDMNDNPVNPVSLEQGTNFKVVVTVNNPSLEKYQDMALTQIFPSGWEIHNTRMDQVGSSDRYSSPDYTDIRDDRVYQYFGLNAGQSKSFAVYLNAAYRGQYYLPAVLCEEMYNNTIYSRTKGMEVSVTEQK
ncbi:MAG: hypothetical protein GVY19_04090 [Bacteroidetes bacterium]|jgi:uncharacterized protein YfaS (alpha-2-macroglobulin family)|nr:hypothetical protein [Bacteroidota bacterium]